MPYRNKYDINLSKENLFIIELYKKDIKIVKEHIPAILNFYRVEEKEIHKILMALLEMKEDTSEMLTLYFGRNTLQISASLSLKFLDHFQFLFEVCLIEKGEVFNTILVHMPLYSEIIVNDSEMEEICMAFEKNMTMVEYQQYLQLKEEQRFLQQQSKMASMGEMIGNIAHQWRQPLNALSSLNVLLTMQYTAGKLNDDEIEKFKDKSNLIIQKMSQTIDDFKNFFSPNREKDKFNVKNAIEATLNFIEDSYIQNKITIINNATLDIEIINYENELEQVLLNIFNNAKDAIIESTCKEGEVTIHLFDYEDMIEITVQDNGGGADDEVLAKAFEPYFTTKFKNNGTGIGLYMSKMMVEDSMGGELSLKNYEEGVLVTIKIQKEKVVSEWLYII